MGWRGFVARPCVLALEQGGTEMCNDIPTVKVVLRGFSGAMYFGMEAHHSECDRYTVDTYRVY